MHVQPDHLVVFCADLDQGAAWCREVLGAEPSPGGSHPLMGTHNRLLRLSSPSHPDTYLELLAIDPQAAPPQRPRWFGIDDPALQAAARLEPRLVAWVGRSPQVDMHRWGLINLGLHPGSPVAASRDTAQGLLRWQILLREDGALPLGAALPVLIQWQGEHPSRGLPDRGVSLRRIEASGLPPRACEVMRLRGIEVVPAAQGPGAGRDAPALRVMLDTPFGPRDLRDWRSAGATTVSAAPARNEGMP